jgi:RNA polymerase sigma-70 factor (ECF subfamily)
MQNKEKTLVFRETIEKHKGIFFKVAQTYCADEDDRQDIVQEILIQVWQSLENYVPKFKISTWLYRISLNVAISFYRKNSSRKKSSVSIHEQISVFQQEQVSEKALELNLLNQFINELNELDKALILLYLEEKSQAEIADILGITQTNVATKVGRIKGKLKLKFEQYNLKYNGK